MVCRAPNRQKRRFRPGRTVFGGDRDEPARSVDLPRQLSFASQQLSHAHDDEGCGFGFVGSQLSGICSFAQDGSQPLSPSASQELSPAASPAGVDLPRMHSIDEDVPIGAADGEFRRRRQIHSDAA